MFWDFNKANSLSVVGLLKFKAFAISPTVIDGLSLIIEIIDLYDKFYTLFGFEYAIELSTKPEKAIGSDEVWEQAEDALKNALERKGIDYKLNPGDGAFYGPKIDFKMKDSIGRIWQCGTIKLDFNLPLRFEMSYIGSDGET